MAFESLNLTPIGGNARSGLDGDRNAPMGWGYSSETDAVADVQFTGYFDTINKIVAPDQFIYAALADENVIFTIKTVNRTLQQVTLATQVIRPQAPDPLNVTEVFVESDFGTPVFGSIIIDPLEKFLMMDEVTLTDRLRIESGVESNNIFQSTAFSINKLLFNPSSISDLYTADASLFCIFRDIIVQDISDGLSSKGNNTLLNVAGVSSIDGLATLQNCIIKNFEALGSIAGFDRFTMRNGESFNSGGIIIKNCLTVIVVNWMMGNENTSNTNTFIDFQGLGEMFFNVIESEFFVKSGEAAIFIDPAIEDDSIVVLEDLRVELEGTGKFFKSGVTGTFAADGWVQNGATGSVNSIADAADNLIEVTTSAPHGMVTFQKVILSGMSIAGYDDQYSIEAVPTTTTLLIKQTFLGTATGTWTTQSTTTKSIGHGLAEGTSILVFNSLSYNGGSKIYNVTVDNFDINRDFSATFPQPGSWDTGSLTGKDPRVTVKNVETEPDSTSIFQYAIDAGALSPVTTTITTMGVYQDLNFAGETPLLNGTELFTLVNGDIGAFRYDGPKQRTFMISGFISGQKSTGGASVVTFAFVPFIDTGSGFVQAAEMSQSVISATSTYLSVSFAGAVVLSPRDEIKMQIKNITDANNYEIASYTFIGS